ncbi:MAG: hypothetical protein LQ341_007557, partial [Variospora aurantia]
MAQTTLKPKKSAPSKKRPMPETEDDESGSEPAINDDSILSNTPPSAKKQKKKHLTEKTAAKPLQEVENEATGFDGAEEAKPKKGSKSTETYQK